MGECDVFRHAGMAEKELGWSHRSNAFRNISASAGRIATEFGTDVHGP